MGISRFLTIAGAALAVALGVAANRPAAAQDAEAAFYQGKTVRIVVGYGPGGGYDVYARMVAPYLAKALGTTVIVENQPGAGGAGGRGCGFLQGQYGPARCRLRPGRRLRRLCARARAAHWPAYSR